MNIPAALIALLSLITLPEHADKSNIRQADDQLFSAELQRRVKLTFISTPPSHHQGSYALLLLNDGQDMEKLRVRAIVDSLYHLHIIQPLIVVGIWAGDRMNEYGVAGYTDYHGYGAKAEKYDAFIDQTLYPYIKKKTGIRRFSIVSIAGCSLGGLSAFDYAWNHNDYINKVGVFSGSFWWRDKDDKAPDYSDDNNRIMLNKIRKSLQKPALEYWFYAGAKEETSDRDKDGIIDVIDDTKDLMELIRSKHICPEQAINYTEDSAGLHNQVYWSKHFPAFLIWAFGKKG